MELEKIPIAQKLAPKDMRKTKPPIQCSGNQLLAKNIVYWINEIPEMLDIPPRELNTFSISMQEEEFQALLYSIAIIPGFIALSGIFVGWLRKEL